MEWRPMIGWKQDLAFSARVGLVGSVEERVALAFSSAARVSAQVSAALLHGRLSTISSFSVL